jgi:integrase
MASVYKKQNKWWLKYKDATGKQRNKPTSCDTKASARRLGQELEIKSESQRLGLEPMPTKERVSFGTVMDRWWAERGPLLRSKTIQPFAQKHLRPTLGSKSLDEVTLPVLEELFSSLRTTLSAQSCNHLRSYIRKLFKYARKRKLWRGDDPTEDLAKVKGPKKQPEYLRPDEAALLMRELFPRWRPLFATALFTGMRKGELLA